MLHDPNNTKGKGTAKEKPTRKRVSEWALEGDRSMKRVSRTEYKADRYRSMSLRLMIPVLIIHTTMWASVKGKNALCFEC